MKIRRTFGSLAAALLLPPTLQAAMVGQWVASDLPSGPVTTWTDRTGARPATNSGGPTKTTDGVVLDGNDALVVPAVDNPVAGDNTFTATVVCKVTAGATRAGLTAGNVGTWWGNATLVGRELPGGARGDWAVAVGGNHAAITGRGNPDNGVAGATALNDGVAHAITGVFNGTGATIALFVDGVKINQVSGSGTSNIEADTLHFGVNILGNGDTTYFNGSIQEIQIDNAVLADADVVTLQNNLIATYRSGPRITSFTVTPATAYEGQNVDLSWNVNVSAVTGTYSYNLLRGATTIATGTTTSGTFTTATPDLAGTAQQVNYTLQALETGGTNVTVSSQVNVAADPGIPSATSQAGLTAQPQTPLNITLSGSDPNGGVLSYIIVTPPAKGVLSSGSGAGRTYTSNAGMYGADQFTFKVSDGKYESAPATVRLTVLTPPLAPTAIVLQDDTIRPENVAGDFLSMLSSQDPNQGEAHTFTLVSGTGSEENANFTIVGNQLRANTSFAALTGVPQRIRVRSTDQSGLWVENIFVLTVQPKPRGIVINEIHYNGAQNTVRNSFIELYNDGATTVNLTGWRLSGGVDFLLPAGTTLAPNSYLLVAEDPATMLGYYGKTALGPWDNALVTYPDGSRETSGLSNDGDTVRLRDAGNDVVDEVDYENHSPWPAEGNGEGRSIELIHPGLDNSHGSNWRAALTSGPPPVAQTYVPFGGTWRWRKGVAGDTGEPTAPFTAWRALNFTEPVPAATNAQWQDNLLPIGFGDNNNNIGDGNVENVTALTDMSGGALYTSLYLRKTFTIPPGEVPAVIQVNVRCDDGCFVWINGNYVGSVRPSATIGTGHHYYNTLAQNAPDPVITDPLPPVTAGAVNLVAGQNVIAIHAMNTTATSTDFFLDAEVKQYIYTADTATPGVQNSNYSATATAAPAIRQVQHTPQSPAAGDSIIVTARITDPNGVASASLAYQTCAAGSFIPSTLPKAVSGGNFVNVSAPLAPNPLFEDPANWTAATMNDLGTGDDVLGGDGIWTGTIPPQPNRTLVRYRITCADNHGNSARVPYAGDPSLNFGAFVYNGVPSYEGTSAAALTSVPVYHFLTRKADFDQCVAYDANVSQRLTAGPSWNYENWEACFVCNGVVYDHIPYRLKGANGRYTASGTGGVGNGKRAFKFYFHKGYEFDARDQTGAEYPEKWSTMITENLWENRATYTFSLNEMVSFHLLKRLGIPSPRGHWSHFRTIMQTAEQPDKWNGDFWGLMWVHEDYDRRFLRAHDLKKGNLYKLTRDGVGGLLQFRYQSTFGPTDGSDHDEIHNQLKGTSTPAFIQARVNLDLWSRYHSFCEAIRHYDYWPSGDNNGGWYFYPLYNAANNNKGQMWYLPNDLDATWGPTWNNGHDIVHNSLFNDSASTGGDTSTNPTLWPNYFNQIREVRRLLWQPDQVNPLIDEFAAVVRPLANAEFARWVGSPAAAGNFGGLSVYGPSGTSPLSLSAAGVAGTTALDHCVAGMKDFAFDANGGGSTWPGGNMAAGGSANRLDTIANLTNPLLGGTEASRYPATPVITFSGTAGFPANDLRFTASAFSDPQNDPFAGMQWRVAQVNDSSTWTAGVPRLLEITASHDSGELPLFAAEYKFPVIACEPGKRYRARVRMKDNTGRWSLWSNPVEFVAGSFDPSALSSQIVVSEIMYHASNPTAAERAVAAALNPPQSWNDDSFDYVELYNISSDSVDLGGCQFVAGFDFVFPAPTVVAPGTKILIVQNVDAFNTRYGSGKPIAGAWDANDRLSNAGETLTMQFGAGTVQPIFSFSYSDNPDHDWPASADGDGASLVKIEPENLLRSPSLGANWRASITPNPGGDDRVSFLDWQGTINTPDHDRDGLDNAVEYSLGTDPFTDSSAGLPVGAIQVWDTGGDQDNFATLTFRRHNAHEDFRQHVEFSMDLTTWPIGAVHEMTIDNADGTRTEFWRSIVPVGNSSRIFGRVRFSQP